MGRADYLAEGDWNATCSMCGFKFKASELVRNWQGMWRCPAHNEPRQPQDFVRAVPDIQTPPWVQPWPDEDTFIYVCSWTGRQGTAGEGEAGCAIVGKVNP